MKRPLLLLLLVAGCAVPGPRPFSERLLATIPEGVTVVVPPIFSADGRRVAYVARTPEGARVIEGETTGKLRDAL